MDTGQIRFYAWEAALLAAPLSAVTVSIQQVRVRPVIEKGLLLSLSVISMLSTIFTFSDWSLRSYIAQSLEGPVGLISVVLLIYLLLTRVRLTWLRNLLRATFAVPLVLCVFSATVGVLGVIFVTGDSNVDTSERIDRNHLYEIGYRGYVFSAGWAEVSLYSAPEWSPIRHRIYHRSLGEDAYDYFHHVSVMRGTDGRSAIVAVPRLNGQLYTERVDFR